MRAISVAVGVWVVVWVGLGVWTGYEVYALRTLSDTVAKAGTAVKTTGGALETVGSIPLVGGQIGTLGRQVSATGASAVVSGRSSKHTIDRLSVLLGIAVGLVPTAPVLVLYYVIRRLAAGARLV